MTPEEQIKQNQDWAKSEEGKEAFKKLTESPDQSMIAEIGIITAIKFSKKHLTLKEIAHALKESMPAEELSVICRELLIYEN